MRQAVVFGAGAIGLGLLGVILSRSNYEVKFVDINEKIVSALHTHGSYKFNVAGPKPKVVTVTHVDGLGYAGKKTIIKAVAQADVIFTATGEDALPSIASVLADGVVERMKRWKAINIVCCENLENAAALLRGYVIEKLGGSASVNNVHEIMKEAGFANTIIDKMCKSETYETTGRREPVAEGLNTIIEVEQEGEFMVDQSALVEPRMELVGARFLDSASFEAERNKKVFAHNGGHALLAYLGAIKGYDYIRESGMDSGIRTIFYRAIVNEIGEGLIRKYPDYFNFEEFREYVDKIFSRMIDPYLNDTVKRGIRSSIKKIGGRDARLTRAAKFSVEQGVTPYNFCLTIAAALILNNIKVTELDHTLFETCGLNYTKDSKLKTLITHAYEILANWQKLNFPNLSSYLDQTGYYTH